MWFIQIELLNKYCEMLDCNFLVTDFDILRGLLEKYPTFGREKETGLLGALDT